MTATVNDRDLSTFNAHYELLSRTIPSAARDLRRDSYHRLLSEADLTQEGWLWARAHPGRLRSIFSGTDEDPERLSAARVRLFKHVQKAMRLASETERAAGRGYKPQDVEFYGVKLVEALLPSIWDDTYRLAPPRQEDAGEGRGTTDPAHTGDWTVACYDVARAWQQAKLEPHIRTALTTYGQGASKADVAREMSVAASTATTYIEKGLKELVLVLNKGPKIGWWTEATRPPLVPQRVEWREEA